MQNDNIANKEVLDNENDILFRQYQLRTIALSYWNFFSFSLSYCIVYPIFSKLYTNVKPFYNILASLLMSYYLTKLSVKYIINAFNRRDYQRYRTFCKKYKLVDLNLL
jgi:hypothetical protein